MGRIARVVGIWLVTVCLAGISLLVGTIKFTQSESWDRRLAQWGYAPWVRPMVGVAEIASGVLILVPPVAAYGAATLGIVMAGALATHVVHGETNRAPLPLILLALSLSVLLVRRPTWLRRLLAAPARRQLVE